MIKNIVFFMLLALSVQSSAFGTLTPIKGFQEWKAEKAQYTHQQLAILKTQLAKSQTEGNKKNAEVLEKQVEQVKWNLEVVQDLSVTDYVVLYLSQHPHPDRFRQAASKMSTKEIALLMEAYANTLSPTPTEAVVRPYHQAIHPARLPVQAVQNRGQVK